MKYIELEQVNYSKPNKEMIANIQAKHSGGIEVPAFYKNLGMTGLASVSTCFILECFVSVVFPNALVFLDVIMPIVWIICVIYCCVSGSVTLATMLIYKYKLPSYLCKIVLCEQVNVTPSYIDCYFSMDDTDDWLNCSNIDFVSDPIEINEGNKYLIAYNKELNEYSLFDYT